MHGGGYRCESFEGGKAGQCGEEYVKVKYKMQEQRK